MYITSAATDVLGAESHRQRREVKMIVFCLIVLKKTFSVVHMISQK